MTEFGDPTTAPYWAAAADRELLVQRCASCGACQLYPRPFCLVCDSDKVDWLPAAGGGTVYAATTVHLQVDPALEPPYVVAVVELDEGPRLVTNIVGGTAPIGARVALAWREREGMPPLPVFTPDGAA